MSDTAVRYLTKLRLAPQCPSTITTSKVAELLEDQEFSVPVQPALHELSTYFPMVVNENLPSFQWSLQGNAVVEMVQAVELPSVLTCESARAHLLPILPPFKKQKCPSL